MRVRPYLAKRSERQSVDTSSHAMTWKSHRGPAVRDFHETGGGGHGGAETMDEVKSNILPNTLCSVVTQ